MGANQQLTDSLNSIPDDKLVNYFSLNEEFNLISFPKKKKMKPCNRFTQVYENGINDSLDVRDEAKRHLFQLTQKKMRLEELSTQ